jgi:NAD(P)-dependent dehydrogenase (short-subunit alcohol dehydrogenase family)
MKNRICLITGGTSGVGRATAIGLAKLGAHVIIISSSEERSAIPVFVEEFKSDFKKLHVLSNNAAVLPLKKEFTAHGIEKIFAINYLSHFILTYLFLDLLKSSSPARILTVSGSPSLLKYGKIDLNDINLDKHYNPFKATYRAAVAKVAFSYKLSEKLHDSGVTSNTFHPGLVKSNLTRHVPWFLRIPVNIAQYFFSENCETSVYLASSPQVEGLSGKFFKNKRIVNYNPRHPLENYAAALWEKSKELTGLSL